MLNAIQERKRCNRLVIIQWWNTIPFQELTGDHFGVDVKRHGDHFGIGVISGSNWGSFKGWGSFRGQEHFGGGCTSLKKVSLSGKASRPVQPIIGSTPGKKSSDLANEAKMALIS